MMCGICKTIKLKEEMETDKLCCVCNVKMLLGDLK